MLSRIKRIIKRILFRRITKTNVQNSSTPLVIEGRDIVIKNEISKENDLSVMEVSTEEEGLLPRRKIISLNWNGPKMEIKGYYYLEGLPMTEEDLVNKNLIFEDKKEERIVVPLKDVTIDSLGIEDTLDPSYEWAGFEGIINFATLSNGKPLANSEYIVYLETEVQVLGKRTYKKQFPLGNIEKHLNNGFHSAKMEYFTARKELKFNLMATYDYTYKTLKLTSTKLKDADPAELAAEETGTASIAYRLFKTVTFPFLYKFFSRIPVNEKRVIFASDSREELSGNMQYVYEEMERRGLDIEYKFFLKKAVDKKKTYKELVDLAYNLATAKYIILDDFYPIIYRLKIREGADLIQLWHAVGAFKTFGFSRVGRPGGPSPRSKNHRNYTKVTVSSKNVAKHYAEGFGIERENVVATGIPRTDDFFNEPYKDQVRTELYENYPFLKDKKVIMFAPTFRGNGQQSAYYSMENLDLDRLYKEFKDEYVFLMKIHPFVKNEINIPYQYSDFIYDFSEYREINDLLFVTDILITDYSSVCFEFALLNKPMVFFAYDVEEYIRKRDFYYEYHSFIPGPLAKTTNDLVKIIKTEDFKMERIEPFVNYFFDHRDGKSTERVVDNIFEEEEKLL